MNEDLLDILELINTNRMVLFLGSGSTRLCQRSDGSPGLTGQELSNEIIQKLNNGNMPNFHVPLNKAADYYTSSHPDGRKGLDKMIQSRLFCLQPTLGHFLVTLFPWKAIITTNFNFVIEETYQLAKNENFALNTVMSVYSDAALSTIQNYDSKIVLYKPHGCILHEINVDNRLIVSSKDYFDSLSLRPLMFKTLNNLVKTNSTIFIGYSMDDYTFKNIFYDLQDQLGAWQMRLYSVARMQDELLYKWSENVLNKDFNTSIIRTSFDGFMIHLVLAQGKKIPPSLKERIINMWPETLKQNEGYLTESDFKKLKEL